MTPTIIFDFLGFKMLIKVDSNSLFFIDVEVNTKFFRYMISNVKKGTPPAKTSCGVNSKE